MRKSVVALGAAGLTALATLGVAGTAHASSDTYCQHSTCLYGYNNVNGTGLIFGKICNNQSSPNAFYIWIKDPNDGSYDYTPTPTGTLVPGACYSVVTGENGDPMQVFGESSGNWTYGTDPIAPG